MSLRELWNHQQAALWRARNDLDQAIVQAWNIERVSILAAQPNGGRKLPELDLLLKRHGPQSPVEQRATIESIASRLGVTQYERMERLPDGTYRTVH